MAGPTEHIALDRALCIGAGLCAATAPRHFVLDADRRSTLRPDAGEPDEDTEDAVAICPVEAISLVPGARPGLIRPPVRSGE
ncbi:MULTISPECIES: ferredoxin [unclassified Streptomyces]|uniref:ferredoxin n=1 Tax=unclassified Streptomyces TaxID=2593676 RepID=UPI002E2927C4|nr:ferredoxin [Streptomyces sp. NBC_01429]